MFKEEFKYYKAKKPPPDFKNVLDLNEKSKEVNKYNIVKLETFPGLKPTNDWEVYELISQPGLIFIKNPFTTFGQLYFTARCLQDYTKKPNKSNLDVHSVLDDNGDWWSKAKGDGNLFKKLRWITFGYHHNWDTKVYTEDNKSPFPQDLNILCKYIASVLNFKYFEPQAAIINYYHADSTLSGHTDHSEQNLEAPLFSFSFGQSAIFLLGGKTIQEKPVALFVHHGDIIIMSKESRLCYHGIPRILSNQIEILEDCFESIEDVPKEFNSSIIEQLKEKTHRKGYQNYLRISRINMNVRQVLNSGQKTLYN